MVTSVIKLCLASAAFAMLFATTSLAATEVKLRQHVTPSARVIRLGDVAEVMNVDRQRSRQLAAMPLMPAPAPNSQRFLRQREIADMLEANGVDLATVRFSGAERIEVGAASSVKHVAYQEDADVSSSAPVNRHAAVLAGKSVSSVASQSIDEAQAGETTALVSRLIAEYVKLKSAKSELGEIECPLSDRHLAQLVAATSIPVCSGGDAPWTGKQKFTLTFTSAKGNTQLTVYATVNEAPVPMVVATRSVARGNPITAADVEVRMIDAKSAAQRPGVSALDKVIGLDARQALQAGEIVLADDVRPPLLVKRGELITVGSQSGGIRVRTTAKALQDGSKGDVIQVESLKTKQRFDVRVAAVREATVFAPARPSEAMHADSAQSATRPTTINR